MLAGADTPPDGDATGPLMHTVRLSPRAGQTAAWPQWAPPQLREAWERQGVPAPWTHQAEAAELAWSGQDVVVATGTASGKSLAYQLPVLARFVQDPKATALYLAPTKALAADQLRALEALALPDVRPAQFDGDTPNDARDWARRHGRWVFSNPDMLHRALLPRHSQWAMFLRRLQFVVVDECHTYRGVFGSHVALLMRRLLRVCARYGSRPTLVLASATVAEPAGFARRLTGRDVAAVTEDGSPAAGRTIALWEPPLLAEITGENGAPVRRAAGTEAARMLADLVLAGARTLAFVRSRRGAEVAAMAAQRLIADVDPDLATRVAAYRGGYLPEERRALEAGLAGGELLGVATTNALELGVDIAGLDAVVVAGFPGTRASFWQQSGRAGRARDEALVVLVARDDPMDTYLVHHPDSLLGAPVEGCVLDPANPYVLGPQLVCAAAELPVTDDDVRDVFGGAPAAAVLDELVADGVLRRRPTGWYWPSTRERPAGSVDIRGSGLGQVAVVEAGTGRMLGTVDGASAPATVHSGAVYLHRGETYLVQELDLAAGIAVVHDLRSGAPHRRAVHGRRRGGARARPPRPRAGAGVVRRPDRDLAGGGVPAPGPGRHGAGDHAARPARADAAHPRCLVRRDRGGTRWRPGCHRGGSPARCTPPSTPPSASSRSSRSATAGTSAACPPPCTRTPAGPRCSCTTAIPAARASPSAGTRCWGAGSPPPGQPSAIASAAPDARPACSRRSAATATPRWTKQGRCGCSTWCSTRWAEGSALR